MYFNEVRLFKRLRFTSIKFKRERLTWQKDSVVVYLLERTSPILFKNSLSLLKVFDHLLRHNRKSLYLELP